ncbi:MAG: DUF1552 domain-containing protein [Myxococcota bacterium]
MWDPKKEARKSRRQFLEFLGAAGASAGLLQAAPLVGGLLANRRAQAQGGTVKRAVFVYSPDGAPRGLWLPTGRTMNAATLAFNTVQDVCNFREVEVLRSGHGNARKCLGELRWSSDWTSDTIDQQIASVLSTSTPFMSYVLGVQTSTEDYVVRRAGAAVPAQNDPSAAYSQLFSGAAPPMMDTAGFLARERSVIDVNRAALDELGMRAGSFGSTFDQHVAALEELEGRIVSSTMTPTPTGCASPMWNAAGYPTSGATAVPFLHTAELQSDIIVAAMKCGLTNLMTLQLGWHQATWYAHDTTFRGDHHSSAHAAPAADNAEMTNYLARGIAYLIQRLIDEDDPAAPGTKMIDNTVVVMVTDMGDGRDHSGDAGPSLVATRLPGFRRGTVSRGGNNLMVLEAVVEGLGLGAYKGTDVGTDKIWPCAGGQITRDILS